MDKAKALEKLALMEAEDEKLVKELALKMLQGQIEEKKRL